MRFRLISAFVMSSFFCSHMALAGGGNGYAKRYPFRETDDINPPITRSLTFSEEVSKEELLHLAENRKSFKKEEWERAFKLMRNNIVVPFEAFLFRKDLDQKKFEEGKKLWEREMQYQEKERKRKQKKEIKRAIRN